MRVILPGDILINEDNASVVALTEMILAPLDLREIDPGVISRLYGAVAKRQSNTYRDRLIRLGCLTGKERFALFLLDTYNRLEHMGTASAGVIDPWPLSQNLMADAIGLTSVHVNRLLQQLRRADMLTAKRSRIELQLGKLSAFAASFADIGVEARPNVVCRPRMEGRHTQ